jgi:inhibitor of KinA sporulation pathway (predicted exonuclease)
MFCSVCNHHLNHHVTLAEKNADQEAIDDLKKQVQSEANPKMKTLLKSRLDILKKEVEVAKEFEKQLAKSTKKLQEAVTRLMKQGRGDILLNMSPLELKNFLISEGLGDSIAYFEQSQLDIVQLTNEAMKAIDPNFISGDINIISSTIQRTVASVFDDSVIPDLTKAIKNTVNSALVIGSTKAPLDALASEFLKSVGRNTTQARLKIAEFGRSTQAINAESAGLDLFLYVGPKDGITRPFCRKLVGKVLSKSQINRLNNGQGAGPVLTTGGGYNCRHSWAPISKGFVQVMDLKQTNDDEIKDLIQ